MPTEQTLTRSWNEIFQAYARCRALQEKHRHDESSTALFEAEKGIPAYDIGEDGVFFHPSEEHSFDDRIQVNVTDMENVVLYINVYLVDRAYGGPEEGGWYYTYYKLEETIPVLAPVGQDVFEYAKAEAKRWRETVYSNDGRRPISSVLSEGRYDVRVEVFKGESETTEIPYYC